MYKAIWIGPKGYIIEDEEYGHSLASVVFPTDVFTEEECKELAHKITKILIKKLREKNEISKI